ncbi:calpain-like protein, putative [Trypanosoma brucei gambiense DAL972]|uniref:Calpain-like protein, putative n=2 Tax=Trypanosoma brucei TaxID=5691 RepID=D0A5Q2_TRYB9|nr:calpain-like protein, putative [Trypanosoma brucei gambiense DAL972]CBH17003.1 calpain-like protein, putative [Trypanosoma brucei gambiense DAL972]|eukprot:XP_011779267.1 calpain-like protein, putative [Trypanosoma brucei gambiense DAL972]
MPEGVPLSELELNRDEKFSTMEEERRKLIAEDREGNAARIAELEVAMNEHSHELAKLKASYSRSFLDPMPEGVPLSELELDKDEKFSTMEEERRKLIAEDREGNAARIAELEVAMNEHSHELAKLKASYSRSFLDPMPEGVPLSELELDKDEKFSTMEEERRKLIAEDREGNATRIGRLERKMGRRVDKLAKLKASYSRSFLDPMPEGVPLSELELDKDEKFSTMEEERRKLIAEDREGNAARIAELEVAMNEHSHELAKLKASYSRSFLDPMPEGVPLSELELDKDEKFSTMEEERRKLIAEDREGNATRIAELEECMSALVRNLVICKSTLGRVIVDERIGLVPLYLLPLGEDSVLSSLTSKLESMRCGGCLPDSVAVRDIQEQIICRVEKLAEVYLEHELDFLETVDGISVSQIALSDDKVFCEMQRSLRQLRKSPVRNAEAIRDIEYAMNNIVRELSSKLLLEDCSYLNQCPHGVPLADLPLDNRLFREIELKRRRLKEDDSLKNATRIRELEMKLNDHAERLAALMLSEERAFLEPCSHGLPLSRLQLGEDSSFLAMERERRKLLREGGKDKNRIRYLEECMREHVSNVALSLISWKDVQFHEANHSVAEMWPRIGELYPEGIRNSVFPEITQPGDTSSAPGELGYLAPFIAALSQHPPLIHRLLETKTHPVNGPYSFIFFDPNSNPVRVDIDDRVPVDAKCEPKFTRVPHRSWYPLLLEKAYAKFVGGYAKLDQCTPHETLHDLTGRPVTHIPFDEKRADGIKIGDFRSVKFWKGIKRDLAAGDVIMAMTNGSVPDGLHSQCSYALLSVIETVHESNDVSDIVIKLHNCYYDSPTYDGPLCNDDDNWTDGLKRLCHYNPEEDALYIPVPVFLRNFSSMQRCHINCGDRLTAPGEWTGVSCGGNPKFTTFRNNPIYLVENKTSRPVTILAELRHQAPVFFDADGVNHYHQSGLALLQQHHVSEIITWLLTSTTHRFLQKGILMDTREICSRMEIPPNTTCYLVPYTLKRGSYGKFNVSLYPASSDITLVPLAALCNSHVVINVDVLLKPGSREGRRVDFSVHEACDVHLLLHQNKITDPASVKRGNLLAEDEVSMSVNDERMSVLATTRDASNAREQSLALELPTAGRYSVFIECRSRLRTGECPCTLSIYSPSRAKTRLAPLPPSGTQSVLPAIAPRQPPRQPALYGRRLDQPPLSAGTVRAAAATLPVGLVPAPPKSGTTPQRR